MNGASVLAVVLLIAAVAGGVLLMVAAATVSRTMSSGNSPSIAPVGGLLLGLCVSICGCTKPVAAHDSGGTSSLDTGRISTALVWLGVQDPPPLSPLDVDLLCDASAGSSCTAETLRASLDVLLPSVAARPSSLVRLWILGRNVADSTHVATVMVDEKPHSGKAEKTSRMRFANASRNTLMSAAAPYFGLQLTRSPIAETLTKIDMTRTRSGASRLFILITDAREFSGLADFECRPPQAPEFTAKLDMNHVLQPMSLNGVNVQFTFVTLAHIDHDRCPASVSSAEQVQSVWETALHRAGASQVDFEAGAPVMNDNVMEGEK